MHLKNITQQAIDNSYFRNVLATGKNTQIVIMSIDVGSEIGSETHANNDQVLYLVGGRGRVVLDGEEKPFEKGDIVLVPAGTKHNFITEGDEPMKIITAYSPPNHPVGTIHKTKAEADSSQT